MIGSIIPYTKSTIPSGYLVCDGSAVLRSSYPELFSVIGVTYGPGDGETTFNLPDMAGRVALGVSNSHLLGVGEGEEAHSLIADEMPIHVHSIPDHGHTNNISFATPSFEHSITAQPSFTYTKLNGTRHMNRSRGGAYQSVTNASMSRATNVAISDHPATDCTMSGGVTDCPAFDTETTGNGDAHNNMMPYIALVYLIQAE